MQRPIRIGATGALGAVTLLWLGWLSPLFFPAGTMLLTVSLVPLASGLRVRGGALLGLLFGVLWIAARLGLTDQVSQHFLINQENVIAMLGMVAVGVMAGASFGDPELADSVMPPAQLVSGSNRGDGTAATDDETEEQELVRQALQRHKEWMADWDRKQHPWVSFDTHVRELLQNMTGAKRTRCYHLRVDGKLYPLNAKATGEFAVRSADRLLSHVLTCGRRYTAAAPSAGPMLHQLAAESDTPVAWAIPIRDQAKIIGLITVEGFHREDVSQERLDLAADLIEQFWRHLFEADELRVARLTDPASGVLNRGEFLSILNDTIEGCYELYEPVVIVALSVEGIRRLDDAGDWAKRNEVIELVGHTMHNRLRHDDIVGRFSDELFVAILRRLDVSLAELIFRKLMEAVETSLDGLSPGHSLTLRGGLAGSGANHDSGEALLTSSLAALKTARGAGVSLLVQPSWASEREDDH